jgi:hypothetical protein
MDAIVVAWTGGHYVLNPRLGVREIHGYVIMAINEAKRARRFSNV